MNLFGSSWGSDLITRIREVRRARGMTLEDVAASCVPPTTAQTIGRLETGARTVSVRWLNRIAEALKVQAQDLIQGREVAELEVVARLGPRGAVAPPSPAILVPPQVHEGLIAVVVEASVGEYRSGDELWCETLRPEDYGRALNRDILVPRPANRFVFGRLINRDQDKLQILPLQTGGRQQVVANPPWLAVAVRLVRAL